MKKFYLFCILLVLSLTGCTIVETGNVGVEKTFGKVTETPLPQGAYLTVLDSVYEVTTKEVFFPVENLNPKSQDNLTLQDFDADIYFKINPAAVPGLYVKYQGDYQLHSQIVEGGSDVGVVGYNRILRAAREATYDAIAKFPATTMHTKRAEIAAEIQKQLQAELDASDKGAFIVTSINVRNLLTDKAIEESIRARAKTDQDIARKLKEIELATAEADRLRAQAQGEADANQILGASLTGNVMQLRMAEIQRDTIVASSKAGATVINGVNATPLIQTK